MLGVWAYLTTPASIFPPMSFSRIDVVAEAGDLPPDRVRVSVVQPMERIFLGLPGVTRVQATSQQGSAELLVTFDPKTDVRFDLQYVDAAIAQLRSGLPASTNVDAVIVAPNSEPVVSYAFVSQSLSDTLLRELLVQSVVPQFYGTPGLARMLTVGGRQREYHVELDPAALAARALSPQDVQQALTDAGGVSSLGTRQEDYRRNVLVLDADLRNADDIARIVIPNAGKAAVTIGDLGSVTLGVSPATEGMSYDAHHAVALNFYALAGADQVRMANEVKHRIGALARRLPAGVTAHRYWDQTDLVVASQASLRDAIIIGAVLAVFVIFAFLRDVRITLVAAVVIPIAMAIAIFAIHELGQTLNLMSVGGLAVAVGLIIDDAIVVVENVARHRAEAPRAPLTEAVSGSIRELAAPMSASTLTTVVVFVPLLLLTGVSGFFFRALAMTLATSLLVSLGLALLLAPILATAFLRPHVHAVARRNIVDIVLARYEPILRTALRRRGLVYASCAVVLLVTTVTLLRLPSDFLPKLDEGQFEIRYSMPVGTTFAAADAAGTAFERVALQDAAVASVGRVTGIDTNGYSPTQPRTGTIRVRLKGGRRASYDGISDRLRDAFAAAVPSAQLDFHQILEDMINDLSGAPAPLQLTIAGPDQATLVRLATTLADRVERVAGITDVFSGVQYDDPTVRVTAQRAQLAQFGMTSADVGGLLASGTQGTIATQVPGVESVVPVRVRLAGSGQNDTLVPTAQGAVPLSALATLGTSRLSTDISDENGQRVTTLTANVSGTLSDAIAGVRRVLAEQPLPPGYRISIGGAYEAQQSSFREFVVAIAAAIVLVFVVMLSAFRSYRLPLVILTAIPLALVGVALALAVTRTPFNVSSFMGILLLVGIVVKNGILLIDVANRECLAGRTVHDALVIAGRVRLRPIVMTTCAAIGGLLPLALGIGAGAAMERPLAIAVIGGLSTATAFTLIVIPVLYAGFAGRRRVAA